MILLTKSYFMKKIDSMGIEIFKTIYEPLNNTKLKASLESYQSQNFTAPSITKETNKVFNAGSTQFKAKVLVAEDNIINQKLIKRTLEDLGLNVDIASNGLEAFQKRKDNHYDLIFMDIQMPFLDGTEATQEILEYEEVYSQPHVPIIALTANALKGDRERFLEAGLDEYTTKPLVREEIITLLNHFLADYIVDITDEASDTKEEAVQVQSQPKAKEYTKDILLAKKSPFEMKLFTRILDSLGYSYNVAENIDDLTRHIENDAYKLILIDKEYEDLDLKEFADLVQESSQKHNLETRLILIVDPAMQEDANDLTFVDETIKNVINKDLLRLVIEKFI